MRRYLFHDIETRSIVNLPKSGAYVYAEHKTTQVIVFSYAIDDGPIKTWYVLWGDPMPADLYEALMDPECFLVAHNASFERILHMLCPLRPQKYLPREVVNAIRPLSRWLCTAARSSANGLPRSLDRVCKALHLSAQKDLEGYKLMMKMCRPRAVADDGTYLWFEERSDVIRLGQYCESDVAPERILHRALPDLLPMERKAWETTERMNDRGVAIDDNLLAHMIVFVTTAEAEINADLYRITCPLHEAQDERACADPSRCTMKCGKVPKITNHLALREWLGARGYESVDDHTDENGKIIKGTGIGKDIIKEMLHGLLDRGEDGLELTKMEAAIRDVLLLRQNGGKSSTAKFRALLDRVNRDLRVRGTLMYCGAAATGRFSSGGAQLQNMPRPKTIKNLGGAINDIATGMTPDVVNILHGPPLVVASEALRPTLIARPGHWLARGDYSQIESRVIAWFAGHHTKLNAFRRYDTIVGMDDKGKPLRLGPDIYRVNAAGMFGKRAEDLSEEERQPGKVTELACGFGGAVNALMAMCKLYGLRIPVDDMPGLVSGWREVNEPIVALWVALEKAAFRCLRGKTGERYYVGERGDVWFHRTRLVLALRMPSGRSIVYWYPRIEKRTFPWGERDSIVAFAEDSQTHQWTKFPYYGGLFAANLTQGFAREPMAYSLVEMEDEGLCPVLSVHDEAVGELSREIYPNPYDAAQAVTAVMMRDRSFMKGLPLAVDSSAGLRYMKAA